MFSLSSRLPKGTNGKARRCTRDQLRSTFPDEISAWTHRVRHHAVGAPKALRILDLRGLLHGGIGLFLVLHDAVGAADDTSFASTGELRN